MTQERFSNAITEIDSDILDRYFLIKQHLTAKKKRTIITWASFAACLALVAIIGGMSNYSSTDLSASAVIEYGPFISLPILLVSLMPLCLKPTLIPNAISLIVVNLLNILGVYLYSHFGGFHIMGHLSIILITSNIGTVISITTITLLGRKPQPWWAKLLLWLLVSVVSIIIAALVHNVILKLLSGDMVTIA